VNDPALRRWTELDLANGAFGQGVAVTPMQLGVAFAAMVNGGYKVTPRVVASVGERTLPRPPQERIISAALSERLISLMRHVVMGVEYYRVKTEVPGYLVGGKTGTAEIWDQSLNGGRGAFRQTVFNFSFVGYIGQWQPDVVIAVVIREGHPNIYGQGSMELPIQSFDLFRRIAQDSVAVLGIEQRKPGTQPSPSPTSGAAASPPLIPSGAPAPSPKPSASPGLPPAEGAAPQRPTTWSATLEVPAGSAPDPSPSAAP
jgi:membrane peptidoglycan carboxypeptidase